MHRIPALPAAIIPATARAATRDMATSLAPVVPRNLGILPNAVIYLSNPPLSKPEKTLGVRRGQSDHQSLHTTKAFVQPAGTPRSGLSSAMQSAATTSYFVRVSSRNLFNNKKLTSAFSLTAQTSPYSKAKTPPPFFTARKNSSFRVLRAVKTSSPAFEGFILAFITFRISA